MAERCERWNISGEVMQDALERLPEEWKLTIQLSSDSITPYVVLCNEYGDTLWDSDGPRGDESVADCIGRLLVIADEETHPD